ncbi:hypothetical protein [Buchnera aphidicola]|uniref:hypothetical protein n=1 Tax=Buchnera aphidicola TaxID=9 RepID=UPI00094C39C3|nr:hypothetical protein [Buchnera aphidicola]
MYKKQQEIIKEHLLQLQKYQEQYNFFLYQRYSSGSEQYFIQLYINFLLMLQRLIMKQKFWINDYQRKIQRKLLIYRQLYRNLQKWKILESRYLKRIEQTRRLTEQREDNIACLNIYNFYKI